MRKPNVHPGQPLTSREREVVTAVAAGNGNAAIGQLLGISPATAKTHLDRIAIKLSTRGRAGIVAAAIRSGQLELGGELERLREPVICACERCCRQLDAGMGMAHRVSRLRLPERVA